jgi:hypothetical protein
MVIALITLTTNAQQIVIPTVSYYQDDFGEDTGDPYSMYGFIKGTFSNSATHNSDAFLVIRLTDTAIDIDIKEYRTSSPWVKCTHGGKNGVILLKTERGVFEIDAYSYMVIKKDKELYVKAFAKSGWSRSKVERYLTKNPHLLDNSAYNTFKRELELGGKMSIAIREANVCEYGASDTKYTFTNFIIQTQ